MLYIHIESNESHKHIFQVLDQPYNDNAKE